MMLPEEARTVTEVFRRFMDGEENAGWDTIDDQLYHLQSLTNYEIYTESAAQLYYHGKGPVGCGQDSCNQDLCYAQTVVEAASYIVSLFAETNNLHANNRYVLEYYLALSSLGAIKVVTS